MNEPNGGENSSRMCRTLMLSDRPAEADALGTHQQLAEAVVTTIAENEGGKTIALEGRWGSGKSTVVALLKASLSSHEHTEIFVFDAWAHEGDPLRRVFLETLIDKFLSRGWLVERKNWEKRKERLARRSKRVRTITTPQLSSWGRAVLIAGFAVPLGLALFSHGLELGVTLRPGPLNTLALVGFAIALLPLAIWAVGALRHQRGEQPDDDPFTLLLQRSTRNETSEISESPEPTTLEFERVFDDLLGSALSSPGRKLVLVLDNLDRIEPASAASIWSTLQPYFQAQMGKPWHQKFWIIIPYDPTGIARVWSNQPNSENSEERVSSFLAKSIQVRFPVPSPVLSNWKRYLETQLKQAFPDHPEDDFYLVPRILEVHRARRAQALPPSPREIKLLVNQIGAVHRQWCGIYPFSALVYHALISFDGTSAAEYAALLSQNKLPGDAIRPLLSDDSADILASLHYGVDIPLARQIRLGQPLREAFQEGDSDMLLSLESTTPGFWDVLVSALYDYAGGLSNGPETIRLFEAFGGLKLSHVENKYLESIRRSLRRAISDLQFTERPPRELDKGVIAGIHLLEHSADQRQLVEQYVDVLVNTPDVESGERLDELLATLFSAGVHWVSSLTAMVPEGLAGYSAVVAGAAGRGATADRLRLLWPDDIGLYADEYASVIADGELALEHTTSLRNLARLRAEMDWQGLASAAAEALIVNQEPATASHLIETVMIADSVKPAEQFLLEDYVQSGVVAHHFAAAAAIADWQSAARILHAYSVSDPSLSVHGSAGNSVQGYALLKQYEDKAPTPMLATNFVDICLEAGTATLPFALAAAVDRVRGIRHLILQHLMLRTDVAVHIRLSTVLEHWTAVTRVIKPLVVPKRYCGVAETRVILESQGFSQEFADLYLTFEEHCPELWPDIAKLAAAGLAGATRESWERTFAEGGAMADLAIAVSKVQRPILSEDFRAAAFAHAQDVRRGGSAYQISPAFSQVAELLGPHERQILEDDLYELASGRRLNATFVEQFGPEIARSTKYPSNDTIRRIWIPLIERGTVAGLRWILENLQSTDSIMSRTTVTYQRMLRKAIEKAIPEASPQASRYLESIAPLVDA